MARGVLPERELMIKLAAASLLLSLGIWTASRVEMVLGASSASYAGALVVALLLAMGGSFLLFDISEEVSKDL